MLCRTAKTMIHLYRPDELTEVQRRKVERHLARCGRCATEARNARRTEDVVAGLRGRTPAMDDVHSFTLAVMRGVESGDHTQRSARKVPVRWSVSLQSVRPALGVAVVVLFIAFFTPLYLDAQKIAALEQRLAANAGPSANQGNLTPAELLSRGMLGGQGKILSQRAELFSLSTLLGLAEGFGFPDRPGRQTLLDHISVKYPRLASVNLEDGVDERERAILSTEGPELLRELRSIIDSEGKNNAH